MSLLNGSSTPPPSPVENTTRVERRSANYHPSIWGDHFLKYAYDSNSMSSRGMTKEQLERLKEEVRKMLKCAMNKPSLKLNLIDQIQRLGIAYHFEIEIDEQLEQIHKNYYEFCYGDNNDNLHTIALLFRLLRQQGYSISCEIFNKFNDEEGNLSKSLMTDVQGLLSLFEACHLRYHGENILDDALAFTTTHLESIDKTKVNPSLVKRVSHALYQPIHEGMPRLEARHYIALYQEEPSHNKVLLSLAKLDFNLVQEQHQKELGKLTRWWKDLDVQRKFPFARNRLVEMYFWMSGVYFEPEYQVIAREILAKGMCVLSIIDDAYDVYGTFEELELFTEAINRWDFDAKDGLPEYMQACSKIILDLYDEIGHEVMRKGRSYRLFYAKEAMKRQVRGYFAEAKWFHQSHVPTMEEYMPIAVATIGVESALVTSFMGMGDVITSDAFDWLLASDNKMVKASATVCRLMDDIVGYKFEQERGHSASSVECFMKQFGVTEEVAKEELRKQVVDAWKDINRELGRPTAVPMLVLARVLNLTRATNAVYIDGKDNYSHAETKLKEYVTSVLVDPMPM